MNDYKNLQQNKYSQPCPLCGGRRWLPVHAVHLSIARETGRDEIKTLFLPVNGPWLHSNDWLQGISPESVRSWHISLHYVVDCDCQRGLGRLQTYSDLIPGHRPRPDDWEHEASSRKLLYAMLQATWPGKEFYVIAPKETDSTDDRKSTEEK